MRTPLARRLLLVALVLACACPVAEVVRVEEAAPEAAPTEPEGDSEEGTSTLVVHVDRSETDGRDTPEVWLRDLAAPDAEPRRASHRDFRGGGATSFTELKAGNYEVALKLGVCLNGPWLLSYRTVNVPDAGSIEVVVGLPTPRTATFAVEAERHSPPFYLVLSDPDVEWSDTMSGLAERLDEDVFPTRIRYEMQSDGHSGLDRIPLLVPGDYLAVVVANDWQGGDPVPMPRTIPLTLRAGETVTLRLDGKLTRLSVE